MSQLTKFASLVVLSTALSAAGCMAKTTASEDTGAPLDEAKQASQTEEMDSADQESGALPATGVSSENSGSADPGSADAGSTSAGGEESAGEQPDASRFWGGGWGWHGGFRPWG
ncbi:MAG TPA: hypothetical protein VL242_36885, partial [Sorangium sp.]|nr:hypothetical protein [Sorangium sp.]